MMFHALEKVSASYYIKNMEKLKVFEAFSGYGSQAMALRNLGINFETVCISEIDKYAIDAYNSIHGDTLNLGDISKIDPSEIPDHDLFTYSFPCTDISAVGKQLGLGQGETRSGLLWECEKVVAHKRPKFLLMENVKPLVSKKFINDFEKWCKLLESYGYTNHWKVINPTQLGFPQSRQRVYMVSILGESNFEFPSDEELTLSIGDFLESSVDSKYYIQKDKMVKINNWNSQQNPFDRVIGSKGISPCLTARGAGEYHAGAIVIGDTQENVNVRDAIANDVDQVESNLKPRFLTPRESLRLMGVNDSDIDKITHIPERQLYKLAGNSIVVKVLEKIFEQMFK